MNKLKTTTILPILALALLTACGLWQPKPPVGDDQWLTPDEAYEDQKAHTGLRGPNSPHGHGRRRLRDEGTQNPKP